MRSVRSAEEAEGDEEVSHVLSYPPPTPRAAKPPRESTVKKIPTSLRDKAFRNSLPAYVQEDLDQDDAFYTDAQESEKGHGVKGRLQRFADAVKGQNNVLQFIDTSDEDRNLFFARRVVQHPYFESSIAIMIALNTLVIAIETQYQGYEHGYNMGYPKYDRPAEEVLPNIMTLFFICDYVFGIIFTLEFFAKVVALRSRWVLSWWNWFDGCIVTFWLLEKLSSGDSVLFSPMILRLARLGRLLRLLRLVRTIQGFDSLFLMTTAMKGSMSVLIWSAVLLFVFQLMIALMINNALYEFMTDPTVDETARLKIFEYFGSCSRATLTLFEITLGNWPPVARILQENVSEAYVIFSVGHKLTIGFAVIGVINGVFMQETFNVAASDDILMLRQKERVQKLHMRKMQALFAHADKSGDGYLDYEEFKNIVHSKQVKIWLSAQELDASDAKKLFGLMDDGDHQISATELVHGAARLKGFARSMDLLHLMREHETLNDTVGEVYKCVKRLCALQDDGEMSHSFTQRPQTMHKPI
jgi:hypothetical protein